MTIADVARAAQVSPATVSRALTGQAGVTPETRDRVRQAAEHLDYVASPSARGLATGRTGTIGVLTAYISRWFFAQVLQAVESQARLAGKRVTLGSLEGDERGRRSTLTPGMLRHRVDGVLVVNLPMTSPELAAVRDLGLPVVSIGHEMPGVTSIGVDDELTTRLPTSHLLEAGHRDIAYIGQVAPQDEGPTTPARRVDGFVTTMQAAGATVREDWLVPADWTTAGGYAAAMRLLSETGPAPRRPTAIVAGSDEMALGVIAATRDLGLRVPQDVSLTGIDDHPMASVFALTTVRQDVTAQGRLATSVLISQIAGTHPHGPAGGRLDNPVELVERGSVQSLSATTT